MPGRPSNTLGGDFVTSDQMSKMSPRSLMMLHFGDGRGVPKPPPKFGGFERDE